MQTQITCPQCGTPFAAEIHQVIDSKHTPGLKQQLLSGQLNVAVCPNCGFASQLSTMLLFHDPEHELFMVHVPPQLNLSEMDREQAIGQLTKTVMDSLPAEERRAYMFQPQLMLNMQTFLEKVLETEGITKEMIERQKKQAELLNTLARADKDVADHLIKERGNEIDETFFAMLQSYIDTASQMDDNEQLLPLVNLRARLMMETAVGRRMEQQQVALHRLNQAAKKAGGLSPKLLLKHILDALEHDHIVDALVATGQQAMDYKFFQLMTDEIDRRKKKKDQKETVQKLTSLRDELLAFQDQMRQQSQRVLEAALDTLQAIVNTPNKAQALAQHAEAIDDAFMYVLSAKIAEAQQKKNTAELQALQEVQSLIVKQMEDQMPPEVQLLNQLVRMESVEAQARVLDENAHLLSRELVTVIDQVRAQASGGQARGAQDNGLDGRLQNIKAMIEARLK